MGIGNTFMDIMWWINYAESVDRVARIGRVRLE